MPGRSGIEKSGCLMALGLLPVGALIAAGSLYRAYAQMNGAVLTPWGVMKTGVGLLVGTLFMFLAVGLFLRRNEKTEDDAAEAPIEDLRHSRDRPKL